MGFCRTSCAASGEDAQYGYFFRTLCIGNPAEGSTKGFYTGRREYCMQWALEGFYDRGGVGEASILLETRPLGSI